MIFSLILFGPQSCAECVLPEESFEDKDVDFLISKLDHWRVRYRDRAVWNLKYRTGDREKIIAELTHALLNDTHEEIRVSAAQVLARQTPPAAEAVPALIEALNVPENDRGKPLPLFSDVLPLPMAAASALRSIGTPEGLAAIDDFKKAGPKLLESSVADSQSEVDAQFINKNGITLRFNDITTRVSCTMYTAGKRKMWRRSFKKSAVTFKPGFLDPKLINGKSYRLYVYVKDDFGRGLSTEITFTTKR